MKKDYKALIQQSGYKVSHIAKELGITRQWLSECINKPEKMTTNVRIKLDKFLNKE